ncbi:hypothetical protein [Streptomyces sp. TLI_171]|uniref:hypothetical protein n=1 Tax=Streptomyces sp. TLI_171 TaxID=1938859 RepID=UPI000C19EC2E|nr:hypothetical protein [Streptomyces sp. TLI_171]RKE17634.1 hypothetical protein BX266_0896 [Streptomyces sp. TLI_171]
MICPNCRVDLRQKERTGHTCSRCRKVFALDPKVEPGRLHDIKFRELVAKATAGGLKITVEQLYWVNERRQYRFPVGTETRGSVTGGVVLGVVALLIGWFATMIGAYAWILFGPVVLVLAVLSVRQFTRARQPFTDPGLYPRTSPADFENRVVGRWLKVYPSLPPGLVRQVPAGSPVVTAKARAVVLCEIPAVADFLRANDFAARHQVLLVDSPDRIPAALPVVVLRDLSLAALAYSVAMRAALPGRRVVDAGLAPRSVLVPAKAVRLRTRRSTALPAQLEASPGWQRLSPQERDWLICQWHSPLVSMPPAKLLALVEKAVERAVTVPAAPPESPADTRRQAERIGFLTWPQAVPAPRTGSDAPAPRPTDGGR